MNLTPAKAARRRKPKPSRKAEHQKGYRSRYKEGTIKPPIPVTERHTEALIRRALTYGTLTKEQAEAASRNRQWIVQEVSDVLEKLADEWA